MMLNSIVISKGTYIDKELVKDLYNFLKFNDLMPKDYILTCFQSEDEDFGLEYIKQGDFDEYYELEKLSLPYYINTKTKEEKNLRNIIKEMYDVDIFNHFDGINKGLNDIAFSILHEFGHLYEYLTSTRDDFYNSTREYAQQLNIVGMFGGYINMDDLQLRYRGIKQERYADRFAINIMKVYKRELEKLLEKYNNGSYEEVDDFGEFYEI